MTKNIKKYLKKISEKLDFKAVYPLNANLRLGDTGYLEENVFTRDRNLEKYGIQFDIRESNRPAFTEWFSEDAVSFGTGVGASMAQMPVKGKFSIKFKRKGAMFVRLGNHVIHEIEDLAGLGNEILERYSSKNWKPWRVVVTEVIVCSGVVILVSGSENASAELSLKADLTPDIVNSRGDISLDGIEGTFEIKMAGEAATPFIRTRGIVKHIFTQPRFRTTIHVDDQADGMLTREQLRWGIVEHSDQLLSEKDK